MYDIDMKCKLCRNIDKLSLSIRAALFYLNVERYLNVLKK